MKMKPVAKYFARSCQVFMMLLLFAAIVHILQAFGIITVEWLSEMAPPRAREQKPEPQRAVTPAEERGLEVSKMKKRFLADGTIHLIETVETKDERSDWDRLLDRNRAPARVRIYDANLNVLWEGADSERPTEYRQYVPFESYRGERWQAMRGYRKYEPEFRIDFSYPPLEITVEDGGHISQTWRYEWRGENFTGYRTGFGKMGHIGANGFSERRSESQPLGANGYLVDGEQKDSILWATVSRLYEIDFRERKVKGLFESAGSDIASVNTNYWRPEPEASVPQYTLVPAPIIIVGTKDGKYHLIEKGRAAAITVTVPGERHSIEFAAVEDDGVFLMRYESSGYPPPIIYGDPELLRRWYSETSTKPTDHRNELYRVDADGSLHLLNSIEWTTPGGYDFAFVGRPDASDAAWRYASAGSPYLYDLLMRVEWRPPGGLLRSFGLLSEAVWFWKPQILSLNLVVSALMVVLAFIHARPRRVGWGRMVCWLVFVGLFNAAGLVTYLALNHTTTIRCAACGRKRGLEGSGCVRCGGELAVPERKATDLVLCS